MKNVNLSFKLKNLDGIDVEIEGFTDGTVGQLISNLLINEIKGDAIKLFDWATLLNKNKVVVMDDSDFIKFKTLITETDKLTILAKAQILKYLETLK